MIKKRGFFLSFFVNIIEKNITILYIINMSNVILTMPGNIGNLLFKVAIGLYRKEKFNDNVIFYNNEKRDDVKTQLQDYIGDIVEISDSVPDINVMVYNEIGSVDYSPINYDSNVLINGFRQNENYWDCDREFIRDKFGPSDEIVEKIKKLYSDVDFDNCVSLSVRRYNECATYMDNLNRYIGRLSKDWYMGRINAIPQDKTILVISEDIEWCKHNLKDNRIIYCDRDTTDISLKKSLVDFYIPTLCHDNIISNSTFSWWGAYLNKRPDRTVIAPYPFFNSTKSYGIYPMNDNWFIGDSLFETDGKYVPCDNQQLMLVGRAYDGIYSSSYYKKTALKGKDFLDTRKFKLEYYTGYDTGAVDNDHHMTTRCFYDIVIPAMSERLSFNFNKDDFHLVEYKSEDGKFDLSYLYPNADYDFKVEYDNFTESKTEEGKFDVLVGVNDTDPNNTYSTNYHRLSKIAHRCGIITNKTIDNDKSILVSGDSHMIPVVPILACYYKTVVFLDNRNKNDSHKYMYEGKYFTDALFEFFEETKIFEGGKDKPITINLL